jgi:outer membrane protein W
MQAGAEYNLRGWNLFLDYKYVWISVDADGSLGNAPVTARVKLNPSLFSAGFKFRF